MRQRGFTLVEVMVALGVLALLAVLSWRSLDGMGRAQAQTAARADEGLALQTGLAQWTADLDAMVQLPQITALEWNGRSLRLTRRGTASVVDGVRVVAWTRREGQWLRWQSPPLTLRGEVESAWQQADLWAQNPGPEARQLEVAVVPLDDWQLFYFRNDSWSNPLSSDGQDVQARAAGAPGGQATTIPEGVRLVLELPTGRAISGRITRDWVSPAVGGGKS